MKEPFCEDSRTIGWIQLIIETFKENPQDDLNFPGSSPLQSELWSLAKEKETPSQQSAASHDNFGFLKREPQSPKNPAQNLCQSVFLLLVP